MDCCPGVSPWLCTREPPCRTLILWYQVAQNESDNKVSFCTQERKVGPVRDMRHGCSLIGAEEEFWGLKWEYSGFRIREAYILSFYGRGRHLVWNKQVMGLLDNPSAAHFCSSISKKMPERLAQPLCVYVCVSWCTFTCVSRIHSCACCTQRCLFHGLLPVNGV